MDKIHKGGIKMKEKVHKAIYRQYWVGVVGQGVICGRSTFNSRTRKFNLLTSERWNGVTCKDCLRKKVDVIKKDGGK